MDYIPDSKGFSINIYRKRDYHHIMGILFSQDINNDKVSLRIYGENGRWLSNTCWDSHIDYPS